MVFLLNYYHIVIGFLLLNSLRTSGIKPTCLCPITLNYTAEFPNSQ